ncbi:hypothetical protein DdX_11098 [Ditylenchus destructor]|uniref:Uncharacterized protein n=1 Tax=Ditylenchus destructor TaxID=166010 RepID=A0AAD4MZV4_9BILA|nr:hypothetical protein DdX_11098 [Ditylenchus destructor]
MDDDPKCLLVSATHLLRLPTQLLIQPLAAKLATRKSSNQPTKSAEAAPSPKKYGYKKRRTPHLLACPSPRTEFPPSTSPSFTFLWLCSEISLFFVGC